MAISRAPKAGGDGALLKTWRQEGPTGTRAKLWLRIRRAAAIILAIGLLGALGYLIISPLYLPRTYFAYWCLDEVKPLVAPPIEFAYEDFSGFVPLQPALSPLQGNKNLVLGRLTTRAKIDEQLSGFSKSGIRDNDTLILYVSAHGLTRNGKAYLMCSDFDEAASEQKSEAGLFEVAELIERVDRLPGAIKVILLDVARCDYAPRLGVTMNFFAETLKSEIEKLKPSTVYVMSSCSAGETSHVSQKLRRSIFGYVAAAGLQGAADLNADGEVTLQELQGFVSLNVSEWVKKASGGVETQTPFLIGADAPKGTSHLIFSRGLPEPETEPESDTSILGNVAGFLADEFEGTEIEAIGKQFSDAVGGDGEPVAEDVEEDDATEPKEPRTASSSNREKQESDEIKLFSRAWELTNQLAENEVSPIEYAPQLWRLHKDRLLWLEQWQQAGLHRNKDFVDELNDVIRSLEDYNNPKKEIPNNKTLNVVDVIRIRRPKVPFEIDLNQPPSLALAEEVVRWDAQREIPEKLVEFDKQFQGWLDSPDGIEDLNETLKSKWDDDWADIYEYQLAEIQDYKLVGKLLPDSKLPLETIKLAFKVRRLGEKTATNFYWGQGWASDLVDQADRLRLEAERLLVKRSTSDWHERAKRNLEQAQVLYGRAKQKISEVCQAELLHQRLLDRARDYLRWFRYCSSNKEEYRQHLERLFAALVDVTTELNSSNRSALSYSALLDRLRKNLEEPVSKTVKSLTSGSDTKGAPTRMTALLRTSLLKPGERTALIQSRSQFDDDYDLEPSSSTPLHALTREELSAALNQLRAELDFVEIAAAADKNAEAADASTVSMDWLTQEAESLRERLSTIPEKVYALASDNYDLSDRNQRSRRLAALRRVRTGFSVIDTLDLNEQLPSNLNEALELAGAQPNFAQRIHEAHWFDLLESLRERHWRAMADAPPEELAQQRKIDTQLASLASIDGQPEVAKPPIPGLDLKISQEVVKLDATDRAELNFTVRTTSNTPVWIVAQYDDDLIDVQGVNVNVLKEHELVGRGNPVAGREYPYRPDPSKFQSPPLPANRDIERTLTVIRKGTNTGNGTLVLRAVTASDYVRREVPISLPGYQELKFSVNGQSIDSTSSTLIRLYPNQEQELTFQVTNIGTEQKSCKASLYTPQSEPKEVEIPLGSLDADAARSILKDFGNLTPVALNAEMNPPPKGSEPIRFDLGLLENQALLGADPKKADPPTEAIEIPLSYGLLLEVVDEKQNHMIRWIKFNALRPGSYLDARAQYNPSSQTVTVYLEAIAPTELSRREIPVALKLDERLKSSDGGQYTATLRDAANFRGELLAMLNGNWPRDLDPDNPDIPNYLPVEVEVDGYPRAFVFHVLQTNVVDNLSPVKDIAVVDVVELDRGEFAKEKQITPTVRVDAPEGYFDGSYVEIGIDRDQDGELNGDERQATRRQDRQLQFFAKKAKDNGTLIIKSDVRDHEVPLWVEGVSGNVNVLAQMRTGSGYGDSDYVTILLDNSGPQFQGIPETYAQDDKLIIEVNVEEVIAENAPDEVRVRSVEAAFDSFQALVWVAGVRQVEGHWRIEMDTAKLTPGRHDIKIRATDRLGNSTEFRDEWTKEAGTGQSKPQADKATTVPAGPVKNLVTGKVTYGRNEVTQIKVILKDGPATVQPAEIGRGGTFSFGLVPAGTYTLVATGMAAGNPRGAEISITVSDQPQTESYKEVKLSSIRPR